MDAGLRHHLHACAAVGQQPVARDVGRDVGDDVTGCALERGAQMVQLLRQEAGQRGIGGQQRSHPGASASCRRSPAIGGQRVIRRQLRQRRLDLRQRGASRPARICVGGHRRRPGGRRDSVGARMSAASAISASFCVLILRHEAVDASAPRHGRQLLQPRRERRGGGASGARMSMCRDWSAGRSSGRATCASPRWSGSWCAAGRQSNCSRGASAERQRRPMRRTPPASTR